MHYCQKWMDNVIQDLKKTFSEPEKQMSGRESLFAVKRTSKRSNSILHRFGGAHKPEGNSSIFFMIKKILITNKEKNGKYIDESMELL